MRFSFLLALTLPLLAGLTARPAQAFDPSEVCTLETARQERIQGIPDRLLHSIALVESGRWDPRREESFAWPWTVMAEGKGRFLPTKAEAIAEVQKLRAKGVTNIDVGCMQINLRAHKDAFRDLDEAFDPASNVAYAGRFLSSLYDNAGNWSVAGSYYHSQTPELAARYKAKLVARWNSEKARSGGAPVDIRLASATVSADERLPLGLRPLSMASAPTARAADPALEQNRKRAEAQQKLDAERQEAKRVADAYRQAKLEEYRQRRQQQTQNRG